MEHLLDAALHWTTLGIEVAGILAIVIGIVMSLARFAVGGPARYQRLRSELGRAILIGLELLVAADIIDTVAIEPSLESVALLGAIVVIRTFLSLSLEVEIDGKWPWQPERHPERRAGARH